MSTAILENPLDQITAAQKRLADKEKAGRQSMAMSWAGEQGPCPIDLDTAAQAIKRLRTERDDAKATAENQRKNAEDANARLNAAGVASAAELRLVKDELHRVHIDAESFKANVRTTMQEQRMIELPGISGYFVSESPLLACVEGTAAFMSRDPICKEEYLRQNGWRLVSNINGGQWKAVNGITSHQFDVAVAEQLKTHAAIFKKMGIREYWLEKKGERLKAEQKAREAVENRLIDGMIAVPAEMIGSTEVVNQTTPIETALPI